MKHDKNFPSSLKGGKVENAQGSSIPTGPGPQNTIYYLFTYVHFISYCILLGKVRCQPTLPDSAYGNHSLVSHHNHPMWRRSPHKYYRTQFYGPLWKTGCQAARPSWMGAVWNCHYMKMLIFMHEQMLWQYFHTFRRK